MGAEQELRFRGKEQEQRGEDRRLAPMTFFLIAHLNLGRVCPPHIAIVIWPRDTINDFTPNRHPVSIAVVGGGRGCGGCVVSDGSGANGWPLVEPRPCAGPPMPPMFIEE